MVNIKIVVDSDGGMLEYIIMEISDCLKKVSGVVTAVLSTYCQLQTEFFFRNVCFASLSESFRSCIDRRNHYFVDNDCSVLDEQLEMGSNAADGVYR